MYIVNRLITSLLVAVLLLVGLLHTMLQLQLQLLFVCSWHWLLLLLLPRRGICGIARAIHQCRRALKFIPIQGIQRNAILRVFVLLVLRCIVPL